MRFFWPFFGKECKKQTTGVMGTNPPTDKSIWGQHTVNVGVCKHRVRENVPDASQVRKSTGLQGKSRYHMTELCYSGGCPRLSVLQKTSFTMRHTGKTPCCVGEKVAVGVTCASLLAFPSILHNRTVIVHALHV